MEVGIDMEKVSRFKLDRDEGFVKKVFTQYEIDYCFSKSNPEMHLCGIFCAKEAVLKTIDSMIDIKLIEVTHEKSGKPKIAIKGEKIKFLLSISHSGEYATAVVIRK